MSLLGSQNTTLVLIGRTGAGKSSVGNRLLGLNQDDPNGFTVGEGPTIGTAEPICKYGYYLGDSNRPCRMVDTPGLDDEEDTKHIADITMALYDLVKVNIFILVLNSEDPRISRSVNLMLKLYSAVLGEDFWKHVIILFSKWHFDEKSVKRKKETCQSHFERYKQELHKRYPDCRREELLFVYIDSEADFSDSTELKMFEEMATKLWKNASNTEPYICQNAHAVQSDKDKMKAKLKTAADTRAFFEKSINDMKQTEKELLRQMANQNSEIRQMRHDMVTQQEQMEREQQKRANMRRELEEIHSRNDQELERKESNLNTLQKQLDDLIKKQETSKSAEEEKIKKLTADRDQLRINLEEEKKKKRKCIIS